MSRSRSIHLKRRGDFLLQRLAYSKLRNEHYNNHLPGKKLSQSSSSGLFVLPQVFQKQQRPFSSSASSVYDSSSNDWRDWFSNNIEYQNPWHSGDIEPLLFNPILDRQSRLVLELLQNLYQVGLTQTSDRVTTQRANALILQLYNDSPDRQSAASMWQRAERARAILEAMELFEELRGTDGLPIPLPLPTHETYWNVLRLYSSKFLHGSRERNAPQRCLDILQRMKDSQRLEFHPTSLHWNQVLCAYANSNFEQRPLKAAQLLYQLDEQGLTDASSFAHALRCCVSVKARGQQASASFSELAVLVAVRVWKGLQQHERIQRVPHHFVHMLRVSRNFSETTTTSKKKEALIRQTFQEAVQDKKVNVHVLQELLYVADTPLVQQLIQKKQYSKDPLELIRQIPQEWIEDQENSQQAASGQHQQERNDPYEW